MFVGLVGFAYLRGWGPAFSLVGQQIMDDAMNYNLSVIPLFILMGTFIYRADISRDLYDAAYAGFGRFRGGLALSTVIACAGFAAVCGSSLATAATMTKVAIPPMRHYRYADSLASGSVAASGTLGIMIPPSVPLVIYAIVARAGHRQAVHRRRAARPAAGRAVPRRGESHGLAQSRIRPGRRSARSRGQAPGAAGGVAGARACSCWCSAASMAASSRRPKPPASAPSAPR